MSRSAFGIIISVLGFIFALIFIVSRVPTKGRIWKGLLLTSLLVVCGGSLLLVAKAEPQTVNGPAPVSSSTQLFFETSMGVVSLKAQNGPLLWYHALPLESGRLTVSGSVVYIYGRRPVDPSDCVYALQASTGSELWHTDLGINSTQSPSTTVAPIIIDGKVFVAQDTELYALRMSDGIQLWRVPLVDLAIQTPVLLQPFATNGKLLFMGTTNGSIRALRISDGVVAWSTKVEDDTVVPVVAEDTVYVEPAMIGKVAALRAHDGNILWQFQREGLFLYSLSASNERVYLSGSDTRQSGENGLGYALFVLALDAQNGHLLWQHPVADIVGSLPVEVKGILYFVGVNVLYALHASDGTLLWEYQEAENVGFTTPTVINGVIFVQTFGFVTHELLCFFNCTSPPKKHYRVASLGWLFVLASR